MQLPLNSVCSEEFDTVNINGTDGSVSTSITGDILVVEITPILKNVFITEYKFTPKGSDIKYELTVGNQYTKGLIFGTSKLRQSTVEGFIKGCQLSPQGWGCIIKSVDAVNRWLYTNGDSLSPSQHNVIPGSAKFFPDIQMSPQNHPMLMYADDEFEDGKGNIYILTAKDFAGASGWDVKTINEGVNLLGKQAMYLSTLRVGDDIGLCYSAENQQVRILVSSDGFDTYKSVVVMISDSLEPQMALSKDGTSIKVAARNTLDINTINIFGSEKFDSAFTLLHKVDIGNTYSMFKFANLGGQIQLFVQEANSVSNRLYKESQEFGAYDSNVVDVFSTEATGAMEVTFVSFQSENGDIVQRIYLWSHDLDLVKFAQSTGNEEKWETDSTYNGSNKWQVSSFVVTDGLVMLLSTFPTSETAQFVRTNLIGRTKDYQIKYVRE